MLDTDGQVATWSPGAKQLKGYASREIIGKHFSRFYTEEDRAAGLPLSVLSQALETGRFETEGWRVRKDGSRFWANVVVEPVRDRRQALIGFAKITRDLTARREAEEALRRSEETFRLLVQAITDYAIYMIDPEGVVISWNPGAQRMKGYSEAEVLGTSFAGFYTPEDREAGVASAALAVAARDGRFEAEGWRVRKNGSRFWASVVLDAIRAPTGELIGFAKITKDLSERCRAQEALDHSQAAFFQAQKMEAVGRLTGGVAHDFNNLLAVIIGSIGLAQRRLGRVSDVSRQLDNALEAAERGAALTRRMLAFARKQELKIESLDLVAAVRGMELLLKKSITSMLALKVSLPRDLPPVTADRAQLELALLNLVVNARDAAPDDLTIRVRAWRQALAESEIVGLAAGDYVCLEVADRGAGMDGETLARAAEPFFTTKEIGKGTGLGLAMVHGLAEQCGGKLVLRSAKGEGTTAQLWLRAFTAEADTEAPRASAPLQPASQLDILAVDDDAMVLESTSAMLEDMGHRVQCVTSGREALSRLAVDRFDLLVTDYSMPGMSGGELAQAVSKDWPRLPVLLVSGYADLPDGALDRVQRLDKPFDQRQLSEAISGVMTVHGDPAAHRVQAALT